MGKAVEELSKNLATGVSRRRALWRFATGIGSIAGLGFLTRGKAKAQPAFLCIEAMELGYLECIIEGFSESFCFEVATIVYQDCLTGP